MKLRVLVACEESQAVTKAFRELGHEAYSCDILPCSGGHPEWHIQDDVLKVIKPNKLGLIRFSTESWEVKQLHKWHLIVSFTPCTFQCNSGVRWLFDGLGGLNYDRWFDLEKTLNLFNTIYNSDYEFIAMENPIPHKYAINGFDQVNMQSGESYKVKGIGKYDQIIQPWQFGHGETKATCLWLKNLPKLQPTNIVEGREQRIWKLPPSEDRGKLRSKTYEGIAKAMAEQWSEHITNQLVSKNILGKA